MRRISLAAALLFLGGCASTGLNEAECRLADWRAIGFEDGARGAAAGSFGKHRKACADHGVSSSFDDYLAGHAEGLETFCRPQNGARLGASGYRYSGVCPEHLEGPFLEAHAESFGLYQRRAVLAEISRQLRASRERANDIEYLLVDRTALLLAPDLLPEERAALVVELKQLTEEKVALQASIRRLELEHAEAEQDYESYRGQPAHRALE
jgi:hypothetical protein